MLVPVHKEVHSLDKRNRDPYPKSFSCSLPHSWALWFRVLDSTAARHALHDSIYQPKGSLIDWTF